MKLTIILALLGASAVFGQPEAKTVFFSQAGGVAMAGATVQGAPYTATITNESVQTLADGNRIVQTNTGTMARDSMGRTRQDAPLPSIGNMAPAKAPHFVFIQDPVAQTSYSLNLTDKTAMKGPSMMTMPLALGAPGVAGGGGMAIRAGVVTARAGVQIADSGSTGTFQTFSIAKGAIEGSARPQTEDLGSQTIEGVLANGTRTTFAIPAGEIGNDKPINIVTEVWTSPDLKTIVLSKRSDPRMGDQTFKLTNIVRAEPDPTLFTVPADFKINDEPQPIYYKATGAPGQ
jgi:hypothetical protein